MKPIAVAFIAGLTGCLVGSVIAYRASSGLTATTTRIETRELVLLDDRDRPAARLNYEAGRSVLTFYDSSSAIALELGVDNRGARLIHMLGGQKQLLAGLNSLPPNGAATLFMGDERWPARIILGALRTDMDRGVQAIDDWGLEFRRPGTTRALFNVLVRSAADPQQSKAIIGLRRSDGSNWTQE